MKTINLIAYNIWDQPIGSGTLELDEVKSEIKFKSGKVFKIERDDEFTFKIRKGTIFAKGGFAGFVQFLEEINVSSSPFNPSRTQLFIEL